MRHKSHTEPLHSGHGHQMSHHEAREHEMKHHASAKEHRVAMEHYASHGTYEHETEKPAMAKEGHMIHGMGCSDYKADADPISYGQSGREGAKSDGDKIISQFKNYHWVD